MDTLVNQMIAKASGILPHAYAPYSKFRVAACIATDKGILYTGVNVENSSYGLTACAEQSAICAMVTSGEQTIQSIVVLAGNNLLCAPCGSCRQKIYEFALPETMIHMCTATQVLKSVSIQELLPLAFDFNP